MSLARYATRRDANEPDIIAALRKIGAEVEQFDEPVDLCVGWAQARCLADALTAAAGQP